MVINTRVYRLVSLRWDLQNCWIKTGVKYFFTVKRKISVNFSHTSLLMHVDLN